MMTTRTFQVMKRRDGRWICYSRRQSPSGDVTLRVWAECEDWNRASLCCRLLEDLVENSLASVVSPQPLPQERPAWEHRLPCE